MTKTYRVAVQQMTCYSLIMEADHEDHAIDKAASALAALTRAQRAAAFTSAAEPDFFEAEEITPQARWPRGV
ncbi:MULTISPECIES: hypothetical protein [Methylosinus]|uniref:Uncharacterized protein n=1 Tax=Methylosinus trichosporium (strain ATCC 35070 / NCIMB 11131 / UNIQEM 75 / OB3b) TaxID=595536 RepID=A0A2D2D296_METT3|nr:MULTISPECIES: hypothetical protein [Methylosinus]ATQ69086.1 hypothetical protein CQW49_15285 [Methylosinus trichosporium OB3b]OBS51892.1 hypothetical protein A8B73_13760 [Methylosinus sp. 3S-1]